MIVSERSEFVGKARICRCPCVRNTHYYDLFNDIFYQSENEKLKIILERIASEPISPRIFAS